MQRIFIVCLVLICGIAARAEDLIPRLDFEDADVMGVVRTVARAAGFDVIVSGDQNAVQGKKTTVHLKNITAEDAIGEILRTNGFGYEKQGKTFMVSALPQDLSQTGYKPAFETFNLKYLSASRAVEIFSKLMPSVLFQAGSRANSLLVRGKRSEIEETAALIVSIDKLTPQILIEGKVMELAESDSLRLGISYGTGVYKFVTDKTTKRTTPADNLITTLNALAADGRAKVVANPRIATLDNQEALINIGNRIPYAVPVTGGGITTQWTVEYIDAGVKLKIVPQLGADGYITTLIQPEISAISEWRTTAAGDFPVISTRNAAATVRVKDGETIVIGGLLSDCERENITRVPIIGYVPIVGLLFQNKSVEKEKTEIVFLITPHVI